ncbi:hypothetical protein [uncultured Eudoraea sp.]|nr:hypothetical protein [uncultured Eudoraea sp.]
MLTFSLSSLDGIAFSFALETGYFQGLPKSTIGGSPLGSPFNIN